MHSRELLKKESELQYGVSSCKIGKSFFENEYQNPISSTSSSSSTHQSIIRSIHIIEFFINFCFFLQTILLVFHYIVRILLFSLPELFLVHSKVQCDSPNCLISGNDTAIYSKVTGKFGYCKIERSKSQKSPAVINYCNYPFLLLTYSFPPLIYQYDLFNCTWLLFLSS